MLEIYTAAEIHKMSFCLGIPHFYAKLIKHFYETSNQIINVTMKYQCSLKAIRNKVSTASGIEAKFTLSTSYDVRFCRS